jgi:cytochrome oxidase Cu insertion factor (SCO1/SenC/PrrC family)
MRPRSALRLLALLAPAGLVGLLACSQVEAEGGVPGSPEEVRPLAVGAQVPPVTVRAVDGDPIDLADLVRKSGALLVFYRGGW